jgi:hypothetical protein
VVDVLTPERRDATLLPLAPIEAAIADGRIHYAALGDRHSKTPIGATGRVWYAGAPEPTDFDERASGEALVVELDRDSARVAAHAVGTWRFARLPAFDLGDPGDVDALGDRLRALPAKERTALRVELSGALDLRGGARLEALLEHARDLFAGVDVASQHLRIAAEDADFEELGLTGFAAARGRAARRAGARRGRRCCGRARRARAAGATRRRARGGAMKITRLRLRNYRGVADREIALAPTGVTVIAGPNEVGKSSLAEAVELLFDERDDTAKQRVREIQPVDRDEGSEVEADVALGPYRSRMRSASIAAARRASRSACRASSRRPGARRTSALRAMLEAHLDLALWRALRIAQGAPLDAPALASATSLAAALDRAAGVGAVGEREESLFERARAANDEYFTPTGRARTGLVAAQQALASARDTAADARARLDALERDSELEATLRARIAELEEQTAAQRTDLGALDAALAELAALRSEWQRAVQQLEAAREAEAAAVSLARQRGQLVSAHAGALAEMESLAEALESEEPAHIAAGAELRHVEERLAEARAGRELAARAVVLARRDASLRRGERELTEWRERMARVERERDEADRARAVLAAPPIDEARVAQIAAAQTAVERAEARLAAEGPRVHVVPEVDLELLVDGRRERLRAGVPASSASPRRWSCRCPVSPTSP